MANINQDRNFKKFQDENELDNKQIDLQNNPSALNQVRNNENKPKPKFLKKMIEHKEDIAAGMIVRNSNSNATEELSNAFMQKMNSRLEFIGKYFNVELDDIKSKLISSVIPLNKNFHQLVETNPDLYGPFWIYTTLIMLFTFAGNLSNYFNADESTRLNFTFNFNFIPNAALFIYSCGFGLPLVLFLLMKFMFKVDISLVVNICIYGYSFTVLAPILILCLIPSSILETILLLYFLISSSFFLLYNMANLIVEKAQASKYIILGIILVFQVILFFTLKFYFFGNFTSKK